MILTVMHFSVRLNKGLVLHFEIVLASLFMDLGTRSTWTVIGKACGLA